MENIFKKSHSKFLNVRIPIEMTGFYCFNVYFQCDRPPTIRLMKLANTLE